MFNAIRNALTIGRATPDGQTRRTLGQLTASAVAPGTADTPRSVEGHVTRRIYSNVAVRRRGRLVILDDSDGKHPSAATTTLYTY